MNVTVLFDFRRMALPLFLLAGATAAAAQAPAPSALPLMVATAETTVPVAAAAITSEATGLSTSASESALPDAPSAAGLRAADPSPDSAAAFDAPSFVPPGQATPNVAPRLTKYIPAGMVGQSITAHDKVLIGLKDLYSPLDFIAMIASAGYEHALNGEPNYGTDRGAFGQRLGAAAIRETSQGFLTDSVFSPLFHEDPRYYVRGQGHSFLARTAYSVTRVLITRTDSGHSSVNGALLAGYASSAALSYTYYPSINQNFHDTASTFGGSLGGAALGYFVSEFSDDALRAIHLKK